MKKLILFPLMLLVGLFILPGCEEEDDSENIITIEISKTDAEEIVAGAITYGSYGLVASMDQVSQEITEITDCDLLYVNADTIDGETIPGYISYSYQYNEEYQRTCGEEPFIQYSLTGTQIFDAPRIEYNHQLAIDFTIEGLNEYSEDELYTGNYFREGITESSWKNEPIDFSFEANINTPIYVSKATHKIYAGSLTFNLEQDYERSNVTYSYSGTIEFVNEDEAVVTFSNGEQFTIAIDHISISD